MRFGFVLPGGEVRALVELVVEAEAAGWDGVFIPDCIAIDSALDPQSTSFDPWVALGAMAARTEGVRLGPMVTPVSRRRPWKLAREVATVDQLSGGRAVLMVGLGALDDAGFAAAGEATDRATRAALLDEGLDILAGLWSGEPFAYDGRHYHLGRMRFLPPPVQRPRVPIWVVAVWPRARSLRRALRWDGVVPSKLDASGAFAELAPDDVRAIRAEATAQRGADAPFEIVYEGETAGDDPAGAALAARPWAEAGVTWWIESMWSDRVRREGHADGLTGARARIRQGPPRL